MVGRGERFFLQIAMQTQAENPPEDEPEPPEPNRGLPESRILWLLDHTRLHVGSIRAAALPWYQAAILDPAAQHF